MAYRRAPVSNALSIARKCGTQPNGVASAQKIVPAMQDDFDATSTCPCVCEIRRTLDDEQFWAVMGPHHHPIVRQYVAKNSHTLFASADFCIKIGHFDRVWLC